MKINTRDFGEIEVDADAIYDFPQGIYGFEEETSFAVFQKTFDDVSFLYLQSARGPFPCFLVFEPWELYPGYQPFLSQEDLHACEAESNEDLVFLVIANIPEKIENMSINIKSPIVMNPKTKKARQVILQNEEYTVRHYPFRNDGKAGK